jgi:hypothetical protein
LGLRRGSAGRCGGLLAGSALAVRTQLALHLAGGHTFRRDHDGLSLDLLSGGCDALGGHAPFTANGGVGNGAAGGQLAVDIRVDVLGDDIRPFLGQRLTGILHPTVFDDGHDSRGPWRERLAELLETLVGDIGVVRLGDQAADEGPRPCPRFP